MPLARDCAWYMYVTRGRIQQTEDAKEERRLVLRVVPHPSDPV